ncbi:FkbM family methyltransferase [Horticoccus sp. 23ND18S-11]|uniref:FkbM family methyltransferase n=1 Tax=Horticoccus sp. 23ND18S-11 TaxID=3391832 RepID=UPI0039C98061
MSSGTGLIDRFYQTGRRLRRMPLLRHATWFWTAAHLPIFAFLRLGQWPVRQKLARGLVWRIPGFFLRRDWENYEREAVGALIDWCRLPTARPKILLDVGSSVGPYSAVALFADHELETYAFEPDFESLRFAPQFCLYAPGSRLRCVHGFIADVQGDGETLAVAVQRTEAAMASAGRHPKLPLTCYRVLNGAGAEAIPKRSLDQLTDNGAGLDGRPVVLKIDVEGWELEVLRGAAELLRRVRPPVLLSVHPDVLPKLGHTTAEVGDYLRALGYQWKVVGVDHEEHWWCAPA